MCFVVGDDVLGGASHALTFTEPSPFAESIPEIVKRFRQIAFCAKLDIRFHII